MSNLIYHCGLPGCLVCGSRPDPCDIAADIMRRTLASMDHWHKREAERLRRLYPQPSPLQRIVEAIETKMTAR